MRLHELAKEIGAESKVLLNLAKELGLKARNHSATLTGGEIALLKAAYREEYGDAAPAPVVEAPAEQKAEPRKRRVRTRTAEGEGGFVGEDGEPLPDGVEVEGTAGGETTASPEVASSAPPVPEPASPPAPVPVVEAPSEVVQPAAPVPAPAAATPAVPATPEVAATAPSAPTPSIPTAAPTPQVAAPTAPVAPAAVQPTPTVSNPAAPRPTAPAPAVPNVGERSAPSPSGPSATPTGAAPARPGIAARGPQTGPGQRPVPGPSTGSSAGGTTIGPGGMTVRPGQNLPGAPRPGGAPTLGRTGIGPGPGGPNTRGGPIGPSGRTGGPPGGGPGGPAGTAPGALPPVKRPSRPATGAKILGRIELPPEELARQKQMRSAPPPGQAGSSAPSDASSTAARGLPRGPAEAAAEAEAQRKRGIRNLGGDTAAWNPDDEDDPLLQGIRLRQAGASSRRPPRRVGPKKAKKAHAPAQPTGPIPIAVPISVRDFSSVLGVKVTEMLRILLGAGHTCTVNSGLPEDAVLEVAAALNREVTITTKQNLEQSFLAEVDAMEKKLAESDDGGRLVNRPPVVAFLGHVDHGKTSLLDRIRSTNVAAGEAGGITQSMRAYSVATASGEKITFLDTPGHKAFTEMRARGANVTDIVVLVVAADDGVMPQTEEAIQHAKAAECPIVVAMNKIDRREANADRVLQQLAQAGVLVESWGGDVQVAQTSATTGQGIDDLLEKILLQAEVMDLKADISRSARGTVVESRKDDQLGAIATVLVQEGTLRVGDVMLSGTSFGRIRKLVADDGSSVEEAGPSTPVNVLGLNDPPDASAHFFVLESLKQARDVAEERAHAKQKERVAGPSRSSITLENLFANLEAGKAEEVRIVLRTDVKGSLEVVKKELESLSTKEVRIKIIRDALGGITEDDVLLAIASQATVIGFNVVADEKARGLAEQRGVDVRSYQIIYELVDEVKAAMEGKLSPVQREQVLGHVEVREIFKVSKVGTIAGCLVRDGLIRRNAKIRLTREGRIIHTGKLSSLKRFKDDVREVTGGLECGLKIDGYDDIKVGDIVEAFEMAEEKRTLDFAAGAN